MIYIRADANEHIGTGHIMRCLSIARVFACRGKKVVFITADHRGTGLIKQNGFSSICLDSEWTDMNGELSKLKALIINEHPSLLLVDSYYVTETYLASLSECVRTVYMDDLNTKKWNVDVLINYNIFSLNFNYADYEHSQTQILLGPKYAPLRDEFRNCPKHKIVTVSDIMVSAGGSDPEHITERIMAGICSEMKDIVFHFIVGALNPRLADIKAIAEGKENMILHINENHMSDLMKSCDIAISAAGTTLYELCATGIPTITYTLADNQLVAAEQFDKQGIMLSTGDCREDDEFIDRVKINIEKLTNDIELRRRLSDKMQQIVDGNGTERIVKALL